MRQHRWERLNLVRNVFPQNKKGDHRTVIDDLQLANIENVVAPRTVLELEVCKITDAIRNHCRQPENFESKLL